MALKKGDVSNFETLKKAAANGHLALIESKDARTGEYRAVLAAIIKDGDEYLVTPFGHLATGNPYEEYADPTH